MPAAARRTVSFSPASDAFLLREAGRLGLSLSDLVDRIVLEHAERQAEGSRFHTREAEPAPPGGARRSRGPKGR